MSKSVNSKTTKTKNKQAVVRRIKPDVDALAWARAVCRRSMTMNQADSFAKVRDAAVVMIVSILETSKPSADRTTAVRKVREALQFAHDAIGLNWEELRESD